jgi:hypothetical protein
MHFARINKHDAAGWCDMPASTVCKLLRALFNNADDIALVGMGRKRVCDIGRMQKLKIAQGRVMPEFDMLVGTHGSPVSL